MATTETVKSTQITNRDASPVSGTVAAVMGGMKRSTFGYVTTAATATTASYYPLVQVPSNARVSSIKLSTAALGAGCTMNIGVFVPTKTTDRLLALSSSYTGGAAIDDDFFATAVDVSSAIKQTEVVNESGTNTIDKQEKELWDALGLASDPGCMLDIAATLGAATVAGGKVGLEVDFVI
jgi:hypothetical protein